MATSLVRAGQARRTETPNALMTTLASPSQGPTAGLSMWRVEMRAGQQGPPPEAIAGDLVRARLSPCLAHPGGNTHC